MAWTASLITYEKLSSRYDRSHKYAAVFFNSAHAARSIRTSRRIHSTASSALDYAKRFNLRCGRGQVK